MSKLIGEERGRKGIGLAVRDLTRNFFSNFCSSVMYRCLKWKCAQGDPTMMQLASGNHSTLPI